MLRVLKYSTLDSPNRYISITIQPMARFAYDVLWRGREKNVQDKKQMIFLQMGHYCFILEFTKQLSNFIICCWYRWRFELIIWDVALLRSPARRNFGQYMESVPTQHHKEFGCYWFLAIIPSRNPITALGLPYVTPGRSFTYVCGQLEVWLAVGWQVLALKGL